VTGPERDRLSVVETKVDFLTEDVHTIKATQQTTIAKLEEILTGIRIERAIKRNWVTVLGVGRSVVLLCFSAIGAVGVVVSVIAFLTGHTVVAQP
jgi:hypothetical protein